MVIIPPFTELLMNYDAYKEYCGDRSTNEEKHRRRIEDAQAISRCYDNATGKYDEKCYLALRNIMLEQPRISLYIPLSELEDAPAFFRVAYVGAWYECLKERDSREDFYLGRKKDEIEDEYIVKALHLLPWLLHYDYVGEPTVESVYRKMGQRIENHQSLRDALPLIRRDVSDECFKRLEETLKDDIQPKRQAPYESNADSAVTLHNPAGPFSYNLGDISEVIRKWPRDGYYTMIGGALLKGYAGSPSDYEIFHVKKDAKRYYRPDHAHIFLNTAWVDDGDTDYLQLDRAQFVKPFLRETDKNRRKIILRDMERDLLRDSLMWRGMRSAYLDDLSYKTLGYRSIDGASAFYDDRYRRIATQLFAKYVWLPEPEKNS